jgi:hypothetical protein
VVYTQVDSTVTALLEATNEWAHNIDHGNINAVLFLDLKKAFDSTVYHEILLGKLHAYDINGVAGNSFRSYLSERKLKCFVNLINAHFNFLHIVYSFLQFPREVFWGYFYS